MFLVQSSSSFHWLSRDQGQANAESRVTDWLRRRKLDVCPKLIFFIWFLSPFVWDAFVEASSLVEIGNSGFFLFVINILETNTNLWNMMFLLENITGCVKCFWGMRCSVTGVVRWGKMIHPVFMLRDVFSQSGARSSCEHGVAVTAKSCGILSLDF